MRLPRPLGLRRLPPLPYLTAAAVPLLGASACRYRFQPMPATDTVL